MEKVPSMNTKFSAILESKSQLIAGEGLMFADNEEDSRTWLMANFDKVPFFKKLNSIWISVVKDQELFGYSCFEIIYSMDRTKILDMNYVDASGKTLTPEEALKAVGETPATAPK